MNADNRIPPADFNPSNLDALVKRAHTMGDAYTTLSKKKKYAREIQQLILNIDSIYKSDQYLDHQKPQVIVRKIEQAIDTRKKSLSKPFLPFFSRRASEEKMMIDRLNKNQNKDDSLRLLLLLLEEAYLQKMNKGEPHIAPQLLSQVQVPKREGYKAFSLTIPYKQEDGSSYDATLNRLPNLNHLSLRDKYRASHNLLFTNEFKSDVKKMKQLWPQLQTKYKLTDTEIWAELGHNRDANRLIEIIKAKNPTEKSSPNLLTGLRMLRKSKRENPVTVGRINQTAKEAKQAEEQAMKSDIHSIIDQMDNLHSRPRSAPPSPTPTIHRTLQR